MSLELLPQAVCLLIFRKTSGCIKVLACSRKDDLTDYGLPGGKVDSGESLKNAALREFEEETRITLLKDLRTNIQDHVTPVYTGSCSGYISTTFIFTGEIGLPSEIHKPVNLNALEGYQPKGEGALAWKSPKFLSENGSFCYYNYLLFQHMGF